MNKVLFSFFVLVTLKSFAESVALEPLNSFKASGTITISKSDRVEANYNFTADKLNKDYGILVYEKGDCSSFSSPIPVLTNHPTEKNKTVPFSFDGSQYLVFHSHNGSENLDRTGAVVAGVGSFFTFNIKGKILVLVEMDNSTSSTGTPVACGVHP